MTGIASWSCVFAISSFTLLACALEVMDTHDSNATVNAQVASDNNLGSSNFAKMVKVNFGFNKSLEITNALCLGLSFIQQNIFLGSSVLLEAPNDNGLVGFWSFDHLYPLDESGNSNHIIGPVTAGPPSQDVGVKINASPSLNLNKSFTIDFRIYLLQDFGSTFRNIISRNNYASLAPGIYLYPNSNKLSIRVSSLKLINDGFTSNACIPCRRWTQITLVALENGLKLYINVSLINPETTLSPRASWILLW
ncbi:Concanavalin A-like lectin-glucanase domain superfamily [Babesia duncani]|uniref:Concanavalin A-like lectin-glucanase domain superfamily n=1 Tax=Babesia duncani TaxID=323732 RepID=A0AAD9UPM2_9APIC|nr:Concanavalin A-like lectin-glucanase domain superfamily [Babesia duncani]